MNNKNIDSQKVKVVDMQKKKYVLEDLSDNKKWWWGNYKKDYDKVSN